MRLYHIHNISHSNSSIGSKEWSLGLLLFVGELDTERTKAIGRGERDSKGT